MTDTDLVERLRGLIDEAERWRSFHKQRGAQGSIEALAASIRVKALRDALRAISQEPSK